MGEIWRDVLGYEGVYEVSDGGRVRSVGTRISPRVLKLQHRKRDGYVCVGLSLDKRRHTHKVHRLVAQAFHDNPTALEDVDHINGDRADNRAVNLRWATKSTNGLNRHRPHGAVNLVGVAFSKSQTNPYRAHICVDGAKRHLGVFPTAEAAHAAHLAAKAGLV